MSQSRAPRQRKTVFIIAEHEVRVRLRKYCEERHGLTVETASNPKEALAALQRAEAPCFILLQSTPLPLLSLTEFLDVKARDERIAKIPVVLISEKPVVPLPKEVAGEVFAPVSNKDIASLVEQFCS